MHANLITFRGLAPEMLDGEIMPRARGNPGFVAGYWLTRKDGEAVAVVIYSDEHHAQVAASRVVPPPGVELTQVEVCEVTGSVAA